MASPSSSPSSSLHSITVAGNKVPSMDQQHPVRMSRASFSRSQTHQFQQHLATSHHRQHQPQRLGHRRGHKRNSLQSILIDAPKWTTISSSTSSSCTSTRSAYILPTWIEQKINQLNCAKYVPSIEHPDRCGCGRLPEEHDAEVIREVRMNSKVSRPLAQPEKWRVERHTRAVPTTAFGTVEFQGGPHPTKARQGVCSVEAVSCPVQLLGGL
ncbi:hypothetical protein Aperf_G00000113410 [Anoplocephala perfoliata]